MNSHREREIKFDVDERFTLPALDEIAGYPTRIERRTVGMVSTYYDTLDRRLLASGLTLRQREGEVDAGWQLKVPAGSARTEITVPPRAGADVPDRLRGLLVGVLRGRPLQPVAVIHTERAQHSLLKGDQLLLEAADDRVRGTALGDRATITSWREVELEVGPAGDEQLLQRAAALLCAAGTTPSENGSKLARALGVTAAPITDARSAVGGYARSQWTAMVAGDIALRRGLDRVHKTRVAVRRFRSMMRVLAPVLDGEHRDALDAELSWYQNLLGAVRDRQVQRARLTGRLTALPPQDVLGPVVAHVEQSLLVEQTKCRDELGQALNSERYVALLDQVFKWVEDPPVSVGLDEHQLRQLARKARRKARNRLGTALEVDDPVLLHRARKAAKRARYATEVAAPVAGKKSKRRIKRFKQAQDVLGEHQDSVIATQLLRRLGTGPETSRGQNEFTLGLLYAIEDAASGAARAEAARLKL